MRRIFLVLNGSGQKILKEFIFGNLFHPWIDPWSESLVPLLYTNDYTLILKKFEMDKLYMQFYGANYAWEYWVMKKVV